jgi:cytochrome c oxidase subunit 3/cytochrome o ubiquinol oxidase subunit 3
MDHSAAKPGEQATAVPPSGLAIGEPPELTTHQAGMIAFLVTEAAFFSTLLMAYVYFLRQVGESMPSPAEVFDLPLAIGATICLLSSSFTIHLAEKALHHGQQQAFLGWWGLTIALGIIFLGGTALEWQSLIVEHHLTISRNMFGTVYFTLVGFHALHVTMGVFVMSIVLGLGLRRQVTSANPTGVQLVSWYWHFVDVVWVLVFTLVYVVGR